MGMDVPVQSQDQRTNKVCKSYILTPKDDVRKEPDSPVEENYVSLYRVLRISGKERSVHYIF